MHSLKRSFWKSADLVVVQPQWLNTYRNILWHLRQQVVWQVENLELVHVAEGLWVDFGYLVIEQKQGLQMKKGKSWRFMTVVRNLIYFLKQNYLSVASWIHFLGCKLKLVLNIVARLFPAFQLLMHVYYFLIYKYIYLITNFFIIVMVTT